MKESQKIFNSGEKLYDKAITAWKSKNKEKAKDYFTQAIHKMMISYLITEGIMHMDNIKSVYKTYSKHWVKKDKRFLMAYTTTLDYYYFLYAGMGYFKENTALTTDLKNDFIKLYTKLHKNATKAIAANEEDKFVPPEELLEFVENIIPAPQQKEPQQKEPKPEKKSFFKKLFGNIKIDIEVNGKKKK